MGNVPVVVRDGERDYSAPDLGTVRQWRREGRISASAMVYDAEHGWRPVSNLGGSAPIQNRRRGLTLAVVLAVLVPVVLIGGCVLIVIAGGLRSASRDGSGASSASDGASAPSVGRDGEDVRLQVNYRDDDVIEATVENRTRSALRGVRVQAEWSAEGMRDKIRNSADLEGTLAPGTSAKVFLHYEQTSDVFLKEPTPQQYGVDDPGLTGWEKQQRIRAYAESRGTTAEANAKIADLYYRNKPAWKVTQDGRAVEIKLVEAFTTPRQDQQRTEIEALEADRVKRTKEKLPRFAEALRTTGLRLEDLGPTDDWFNPLQKVDVPSGFALVSGGPNGRIEFDPRNPSARGDDLVYLSTPSFSGFAGEESGSPQ